MARTYLIETFGCQMNVHDSERMGGLLEQAGFERVTTPERADVIVLNTCSVREHAAEKLFSRLGELRGLCRGDNGPLLAVAGCVAQQEGTGILVRAPHVRVVVGTHAGRRLPELIEHAFAALRPQVDVRTTSEVSFPVGVARRGHPTRAYVTILEGCDDCCTFCVVPFTRGRERMRAKGDILAEVQEAVASGRREVQLLGQIVNHYRAPDDPACDFAMLLEAVHDVPGVARIRFASPHPRHVSDNLIRAMRDLPRVCKHIHLPVQSGSTRVLERMQRRHTRDEFLHLIDRLRGQMPGLAISTDMIVGFPGETVSDFEDTLSLVRSVGFSAMYSFKYSERPRTLAARQYRDDVSEEEKGRRLGELQAVQREIQQAWHRSLEGSVLEVLIDSVSRRTTDEVAGRADNNTVVNLPGHVDWIGSMRQVRIVRGGPNSLWGEAV